MRHMLFFLALLAGACKNTDSSNKNASGQKSYGCPEVSSATESNSYWFKSALSFDFNVNYSIYPFGHYLKLSSLSNNGAWVASVLYVENDSRDQIGIVVGRAGSDHSEIIYAEHARDPVITSDGRYVYFVTTQSNLIGGSTTEFDQIVEYDREKKTSRLISKNTNGMSSNGDSTISRSYSLSDDECLLVFSSSATDLVAGVTVEGENQIYLFDRTKQKISLISSSDGRGENAGNGNSSTAMLTGDGRYVFFSSTASNFGTVPPSSNSSIYRKDLNTGSIALIRHDMGFLRQSRDGRYSLYYRSVSGAPFAWQLHLYDTETDEEILVSSTDGSPASASSSSCHRAEVDPNGLFVYFICDSNHDLMAGAAGEQLFRFTLQSRDLKLISTESEESSTPVDAVGLSFDVAIAAKSGRLLLESRTYSPLVREAKPDPTSAHLPYLFD